MKIALAVVLFLCVSYAYASTWSAYKKRFGKTFKSAQEETAK